MAYDEESLFAGIAIGKSMKGWSRAPAKANAYKVGTIPLINYIAPYRATSLPRMPLLDVSTDMSAVALLRGYTTQADYLEVI